MVNTTFNPLSGGPAATPLGAARTTNTTTTTTTTQHWTPPHTLGQVTTSPRRLESKENQSPSPFDAPTTLESQPALSNSTWQALDAGFAWPLPPTQRSTTASALSELSRFTAELNLGFRKPALDVQASSFVPGAPKSATTPSTDTLAKYQIPSPLPSEKEARKAGKLAVQLNWGAAPPHAPKREQPAHGATKACKVCKKELQKASFIDKQWTKTKSCCVDCASAKADSAEFDYLEAVVRGKMLRDELGTIRCCRCHQDRPATTFPDGLFTFASAYQQGKKLTQHSQIDPLQSAICLRCHARPCVSANANFATPTFQPSHHPQSFQQTW
jgi:hypothetical protein